MSKLCMIILVGIAPNILNAQRNLIGSYRGFPESLELMKDSSFHYVYAYDLIYSWSNGLWYVIGDTLFLNNIPIYDTLYTPDSLNKDFELALSNDRESERINFSEYQSTINQLQGQNRHNPPNMLLIKRRRLYYLLPGVSLLNGKTLDPISQKKHQVYFKRELRLFR